MPAFVMRETRDVTHVRAFGHVLRLRNHRSEPRSFRVERAAAKGPLETVTWNGRVIDVDVQCGRVACDIRCEAGEEGVLRFQQATNGAAIDDPPPSFKHRVKVFARRRLSEVRDNYLDRSAILSGLAKAGKSLLPRV